MNNREVSIRDTDDQFDATNTSMFESKTKNGNVKKEAAQQLQKQVIEDERIQRVLDNCGFCYASPLRKQTKHLIIALGNATYLSLPNTHPLVLHHCQISTIEHCRAITEMDETARDEIIKFKVALVKMFAKLHRGCIFLETTHDMESRRHTVIDCRPLPKDEFLDAPIYFKKAILESDEEWASHKKLYDSRGGKPIAQLIPKGFPYFHVEFGLDGGFAHVIEDREQFPEQFGKSVICGILQEPADIVLRNRVQSKEEEWKRVKAFLTCYKAFDWTLELD